MKILVVDDEEIKRVSLVDDLSSGGHEAVASAGGTEALKLLAKDYFDVVVTDLRMPGVDGMDLLKSIKRGSAGGPEVIIMTAYGSIPMAVEAMKIGAFDFITKPFRNETIFPLLERIQDQKKAAAESMPIPGKPSPSELESIIVGDSSVMCEVRRMAQLCARTEATVLLTGETGTGKDLVADTIHKLSHRYSSPFVKVNCAVFSQRLIESELYGHEKGAFTGADQRKKGKFDMAQGGTLFLDDVDDIPPEQQIKLLRVIDEKVFERVGAIKPL
ncbi:MAG: sigma-54-dependent transcriptional regulator, partial [Planctomycetota bacterium]